MLPKIDLIEKFKFYDLGKYNWKLDYSKENIKQHTKIFQEIAVDFSEETGIDYKKIIQSIKPESLVTTSSETLFMLFTYKNDSYIYSLFTHYFTDTYKLLKQEKE